MNQDGGRDMALPINEMATSDRPLNYVRSLVDFRGKPSYIPDSNNTPAILTTANVTDNIMVTASNSDMALVMLPKHRGGTIIRGKVVPAGTSTTGPDGTSYTLPTAAFVPQLYYPQSRNLGSSYSYIRVSSMGMQVSSNAAPNNSNNITGTFSGGSFNSLSDLQTYTAGELEDAAITNTDSRVNVSVTEGMTAISGPELVDDFIQPSSNAITYNPKTVVNVSSAPMATAAVTYVYTTWAVPRNTMCCEVPVKISTTMSAATTSVIVTFYKLYFDASWTLQLTAVPWAEIPVNSYIATNTMAQAATMQLGVTLDLVSTPGLLLPIIGIRNVSSTQAITVNVSGAFPEQSNRSGLGPGAFILCQGLGTGQSIVLDSRIAYEAVPNAALSKDVKTDYYHHRMSAMTVHELPLAEAVFNSADSPVDRIMTTSEYRQLLQHVGAYGNLHSALRYSWGWGDVLNWGKKIMGYVPKVAPMVGSFFGPEGMEVGRMVGDVAHGINTTLGIRESRGMKRRHGFVTNDTFYSLGMAGTNYGTGTRFSYGVDWAPTDINRWVVKPSGNISPGDQLNPGDHIGVPNKSEAMDMLLRAGSGSAETRSALASARFPVISNDGTGRVERLFVSTSPIKSITESGAIVDTRYTAHTVEEHHLLNGKEAVANTVVYISEDITGALAADAARIMVYFNRVGHYLTFTSPGLLEGNSHQLALVAACMGLPAICAYTGGIELRPYPIPPVITPVQGVDIKLMASTALNLRLVAPLMSMPNVMSSSDNLLSPSDVLSGSVTNPLWTAMGVLQVNDILMAIMAVTGAQYLTSIKQGEIGYVPKGNSGVAQVTAELEDLAGDTEVLLAAYETGLKQLKNEMLNYGSLGDTIFNAVGTAVGSGLAGKTYQVGGRNLTLPQLSSMIDGLDQIQKRQYYNILRMLGIVTAVRGGEKSWRNLPLISGEMAKYKRDISDYNVMLAQSKKVTKQAGPTNLRARKTNLRSFFTAPSSSSIASAESEMTEEPALTNPQLAGQQLKRPRADVPMWNPPQS